MVRNPQPKDVTGPVDIEGGHVVAGKDRLRAVGLLKQLQDPAGSGPHILRVDVKEHVAGAAVQPVLLKGLGHAVIAVPVGEIVKALKDAADIFMPQLNHVGNRLVGGFFVVQTEAVLYIILEGAV